MGNVKLISSEKHLYTNPALFLAMNQFLRSKVDEINAGGDVSFYDDDDWCVSLVRNCFAKTLCAAMKSTVNFAKGTDLQNAVVQSIEIIQNEEQKETVNALLNEFMLMNILKLERGFMLTVDYYVHGDNHKSITPIIRLDSFAYDSEGRPKVRRNFINGKIGCTITSPYFPINKVGVEYSLEKEELEVHISLSEDGNISFGGQCEGFGNPEHKDINTDKE